LQPRRELNPRFHEADVVGPTSGPAAMIRRVAGVDDRHTGRE
jgi:hypothetical protein